MNLYAELIGDGSVGPYALPDDFDPISPQHILVHIGGAVQRLQNYVLDLSTRPASVTFAQKVPVGQLIRLQLVQAAGGGTGQKLLNGAYMLDGSDQQILSCPDQKQIALAGLRLVNRTPEMDQAQIILAECWITSAENGLKHHIIAPRTPIPVGSVLAGLGGSDKIALLPGQILYATCSVANGASLLVSGLEGSL